MTTAMGMPEESSNLGELRREGQRIGGKYRVGRMLAFGGMGIVVAAEHLELRQRVALKVLFPSAGERSFSPATEQRAHSDAVARFLREARAAVQIRSEHVVRVMDVDRIDGGPPYIVMELLECPDFGEVLYQPGPLPIDA